MGAQAVQRSDDGSWFLGYPTATRVVRETGESSRRALDRTMSALKIRWADLHFESDEIRAEFQAEFGTEE
jgi:hypothetical protein